MPDYEGVFGGGDKLVAGLHVASDGHRWQRRWLGQNLTERIKEKEEIVRPKKVPVVAVQLLTKKVA